MSQHLRNDLRYLEQAMLKQSSIVEEMVEKATQALRELRSEMIADVLASESIVDAQEIRIEEECLKILALHQPVAVDLRRVATVLKLNAELERIADLAVHVAERTKSLQDHPNFSIPTGLERMSLIATTMLRDAMDSFVRGDADAARTVCQCDDEVDRINRELIVALSTMMQERSEVVEPALHFFSAARQVERIADHATNIAEDVVYLVEGEITRHQEITQ